MNIVKSAVEVSRGGELGLFVVRARRVHAQLRELLPEVLSQFLSFFCYVPTSFEF